jgi:glycosyltransferase involved in cell wall biosynthesis
MAELTVVVPTRNRLQLLDSTLGAILGQRDVVLRVLVIDEGSSDGTAEYLAELGDSRVSSVRNDVPVGLPAARNLGLARTRTRYVAFCDDDDLWSPSKARAQLDALAASPGARWAICGAMLVDPDLQPLGHLEAGDPARILPDLLEKNVVPASGSGLLMESALLRSLGGYDESMRASEDWDLCVRLAAEAPVAAANGPHVAYRFYPGSMSSGVDRMRDSFEVMKSRYGALAARNGVAFDDDAYEWVMAQRQLALEARFSAAGTFLRLARRERQPRHVARAAVALVAPRWLYDAGKRRAVGRIPAEWMSDYGSWVSAVPSARALADGGQVLSA